MSLLWIGTVEAYRWIGQVGYACVTALLLYSICRLLWVGKIKQYFIGNSVGDRHVMVWRPSAVSSWQLASHRSEIRLRRVFQEFHVAPVIRVAMVQIK